MPVDKWPTNNQCICTFSYFIHIHFLKPMHVPLLHFSHWFLDHFLLKNKSILCELTRVRLISRWFLPVGDITPWSYLPLLKVTSPIAPGNNVNSVMKNIAKIYINDTPNERELQDLSLCKFSQKFIKNCSQFSELKSDQNSFLWEEW